MNAERYAEGSASARRRLPPASFTGAAVAVGAIGLVPDLLAV